MTITSVEVKVEVEVEEEVEVEAEAEVEVEVQVEVEDRKCSLRFGIRTSRSAKFICKCYRDGLNILTSYSNMSKQYK